MLAYYRLLGLVAIASLAISGSLLWSLISWLGESRGLALTLAGATGIIVSIGVQVDSNIVYYERIKEEVRRGRAVRSAADTSFPGAFATIVWADLASLIGAGVLYQLTSGTVRGFALYLGLATLIDLAVSYFFMRPLVVFIARKLVNEDPRRLGVARSPDADGPWADRPPGVPARRSRATAQGGVAVADVAADIVVDAQADVVAAAGAEPGGDKPGRVGRQRFRRPGGHRDATSADATDDSSGDAP